MKHTQDLPVLYRDEHKAKEDFDKVRFDLLQKSLHEHPEWLKEGRPEKVLEIYLSGMSLDKEELEKITGIEHYELRQLYKIGELAKDDNLEIAFVTKNDFSEEVFNYYVKLFARDAEHEHSIRERFHKIFVPDKEKKDDTVSKSVLSEDSLKEELSTLKKSCGGNAYIRCFNSTRDERDIAITLNAPLLASSPEGVERVGSKSGNRAVFKEAHVSLPDGKEFPQGCNAQEFLSELLRLYKNGYTYAVMKLNNSFSGEGNVKVKLQDVYKMLLDSVSDDRVLKMDLQEKGAIDLNWDAFRNAMNDYMEVPGEIDGIQYLNKFFQYGGVIEQWIDPQELSEEEQERGDKSQVTSPSVQIEILPDEVRILSSHEQILDGQIFLGAEYPAQDAYNDNVMVQAEKIGRQLQKEGILGRASVDFIVTFKNHAHVGGDGRKYYVANNDTVHAYAIEINVRKGGTTHPFETVRLATGGHWNGNNKLVDNQERDLYYRAMDNVKDKRLKNKTSEDILLFLSRKKLLFDKQKNQGIIPHLLTAVNKYGKFGVTCVGHDKKYVDTLYHHFETALETWLGNKEFDVV